MPALSKSTIVAQIFDALPLVDGFKYSTQELEQFLSRSSFKMNTTSKKPSNPNRKVSVYNCYLNSNSDVPIDERRKQWDAIKSDTDSEEYQKYQQMADKINSEKNIPSKLSKEDKKALKDQKAKADKAALQEELKKAKELYEKHSEVTSEVTSELKTDSESDTQVKSDSEQDTQVKTDSESDTQVKSDSEPETIPSDDENSDFDKQLQQIKDDEDQQLDHERVAEDSNDSGIDSDNDEPNKPEYKGKKPDSAVNNYKEWKKHQLGISSDKSLSRFEYDKGKEDDNFNPKEYDDNCLWYNYIENNMTIINS